MEIFRRQKKIKPKDVFEEYGKIIKTNISSQDLNVGVDKQLKRIKDPDYRLRELKRILPVNVGTAELEVSITVRSPRRPRRPNISEQVEIQVHDISSQETQRF